MNRLHWIGVPLLFLGVGPACRAEPPAITLKQVGPHSWRPPFGLDRVGALGEVEISAASDPGAGNYSLSERGNFKSPREKPVVFPSKAPFVVRKVLDFTDEAVLVERSSDGGQPVERARIEIKRPAFEAEALATPDDLVNPVDLGTILVPSDWLLLGPGAKAHVDVAALVREKDLPQGEVQVSFMSRPQALTRSPLALRQDKPARCRVAVPEAPPGMDRDQLLIIVADASGAPLWSKAIPVMIVNEPPKWPRFGATATKLRYDGPISIRDPASGTFSTIRYEKGWKPELNDVVVSFPNGARFVFWRGSSYIPFWAGRHNTGACYEWAEMLKRPDNAVDCVEPLMDKELRYGRVEIVESTPARVHVRWRYQSTDLEYKVWGDEALEDYYFYPDGYGTRVLNLKTAPGAEYELCEFIIITPANTYPFSVLPERLVEGLALDGKRFAFDFPFDADAFTDPRKTAKPPLVYRMKLHRDETATAVCFTPTETKLPPIIFGSFSDAGLLVTPCYWGSHWPLARGNATGNAIDDRVTITPCHNSVMSWAGARPAPLRTVESSSIDALGGSRPMIVREWAWLIGYSGEPDAELLKRAQSYATPPSLKVTGGEPEFDAHLPERRALRIRVRESAVTIKMWTHPIVFNPVFELSGAPSGKLTVTHNDRAVDPSKFAWDGHVLWLDLRLEGQSEIRLEFAPGSAALTL